VTIYNLIFGRNPDARVILRFLGLNMLDFYRFRDVNVESDNYGRIYIVVLVKVDDRNDFSKIPYYIIQVADAWDSNYIYVSFDVTDHPLVLAIFLYIKNDDRLLNRLSRERWDHATSDIIDRILAGENHPIKNILEKMI